MSRLEEFGINISLSLAGFFGSLLVIGKSGIHDFRTMFISMLGGVASANYLTPVVCDMLHIGKVNYQFSIAFLLGFMGLKGIEKIVLRLFKKTE
jgi:hypothetical protein